MDNQTLVERFIQELESPELPVRLEAVKHLAELHDERAIEPLVRAALNYQGPFSEFEEIRDALLQFHEQAVPTLVDAAKTGDMGYRGYAVQLLEDFKDIRALAPLLDLLDEDEEDTRPFLPQALAAYGEKAVDPLIERVQTHPNPGVRRNAMQTLAYITSTKVALFAEQQLNDTVVQSWVIEALGNPHTVDHMERRLSLIIPFLDSERASTRRSAVLALGKLHDERAVEPLIAHLDDPDKETRSHAIAVLGWIGSLKAVEPLIRLLEDRSVRQLAARTLGMIGDKRAVTPLLAVRDSSNYVTRYQINEALKKLEYLPQDYVHAPKTKQDMEEEIQWSIDLTVSLLDDPNPTHRASHIQSLTIYKDERIVGILISRLQVESDAAVKQTIGWALRKIREAQHPATQRLIDEALQQLDSSQEAQ